jgi:hypothetical protein
MTARSGYICVECTIRATQKNKLRCWKNTWCDRDLVKVKHWRWRWRWHGDATVKNIDMPGCISAGMTEPEAIAQARTCACHPIDNQKRRVGLR